MSLLTSEKYEMFEEIVDELRVLLAEHSVPVGYVTDSGTSAYFLKGVDLDDDTPLYTAPPKKEWVGVNAEDVHEAFQFTELVKQISWERDPEEWCANFAAYIDAKLKEKNT